jgi:hypothetical protein
MPLSPKPPTANEAPSGIWATASAAEATVLSIPNYIRASGDKPSGTGRGPARSEAGRRRPAAPRTQTESKIYGSHRAARRSLRRRGDDPRGRPRPRGEKVAPRAAEIDAKGEFPWDIQKLFAENDLLGIPFPAEYGGLGGSFLTYVKVVEEVSKACASSALIVAVQELGALPIIIAGSDEQKQQVHSQARLGRVDRGLRAHRTGERFRRGGHDARARRAQGRQVRDQRQ